MTIKAILYIDNTLTFGGAINSLKNMLKALDNKKYLPVVAINQAPDSLKSNFSQDCAYFINIKLPWVHNHIYKKILSKRFSQIYIVKKLVVLIRLLFWIIVHDIHDAIKYYKIGKKHNVRIVHLNNILGSQLSGILASKILRAPCVAHLRDFEDVSIITKSYARLINHHIAISSVIKDNLLELGVPDERISIIHDSIDLYEFNSNISCDYIYDEFGIDYKTKTFGIFGRIVEWKGIREFVLAAAEVFKKVPVSRAFIVGNYTDGGEKYLKEVRILVSDLGLKEKIVFTGFRSDVSQLMKFMDVIVHASITPEPFGMVVIEGMAMEKPVIASASGGPLDIIENGKTGLLVDPENISEFADSIIKVLNNPSFGKSLGARGRRRVEKLFTNNKAAADIEKIYDSLIANI